MPASPHPLPPNLGVGKGVFGKGVGCTSHLSGITADLSAGCDGFRDGFFGPVKEGFCDGFCGGFFVLCFPKEKKDFVTDFETW